MQKHELARWKTCDDSQEFEYLSETLLLINGGFSLLGEGWAAGGFFGDCYGSVVPGSESEGITYGMREYLLNERQAAQWLYHRECDADGQFEGQSFTEAFPNADVPEKPDPLEDPPPEIWDRKAIMARLAAWDGKDVSAIYGDIVEVLDRGTPEDADEAEAVLVPLCTGQWPDDLGDYFRYFAIDEQQKYVACEVMRPLVTLSIREYDDMITQPILRAEAAAKLLRWYKAFRAIVHELSPDDHEQYAALINLPQDAAAEAIRATALGLLNKVDWLPRDWGEYVANQNA